MPTVAEVRTGLAEAVTNATFEGTNLACKAFPDTGFDPPGAYVARPPYDPRMVFSGSKVAATFRVWVGWPGIDADAAGIALENLADPGLTTSVVSVVQDGDNWTSVTVDYAQVVGVGEFTQVMTEAGSYFAVPIDVEVCW